MVVDEAWLNYYKTCLAHMANKRYEEAYECLKEAEEKFSLSKENKENKVHFSDLYLSLAYVCFKLDNYVESARYTVLSIEDYFIENRSWPVLPTSDNPQLLEEIYRRYPTIYFIERDLWPIWFVLQEIFRENNKIDIYSKEFEEEVKKREGILKKYREVFW